MYLLIFNLIREAKYKSKWKVQILDFRDLFPFINYTFKKYMHI